MGVVRKDFIEKGPGEGTLRKKRERGKGRLWNCGRLERKMKSREDREK